MRGKYDDDDENYDDDDDDEETATLDVGLLHDPGCWVHCIVWTLILSLSTRLL